MLKNDWAIEASIVDSIRSSWNNGRFNHQPRINQKVVEAEREKKNYIGSETTPYINKKRRKGDTLAQRAVFHQGGSGGWQAAPAPDQDLKASATCSSPAGNALQHLDAIIWDGLLLR